jgi:hypothetical protein
MNISNIIGNIGNFIQSKMSIPLIPIPAIMLVCSALKRPGLSSMLIASRSISRLESMGITSGPNIDGSPNLVNQAIYVVVDEMVKAIQTEGKVSVAVPPGGLQIQGTGMSPNGPVTFMGMNNSAVGGINGIMQ